MKKSKIIINCLLVIFVLLVLGCAEKRVLEDELVKRHGVYYFQGEPFTGTAFDVYRDGQVRYEQKYKNGVPDGVYKEWYENGQIKIETNYENELQFGSFKKWYENGQLKEQTTLKYSAAIGSIKHWHENGQLAYEIELKDDFTPSEDHNYLVNDLKSYGVNYVFYDRLYNGKYRIYYENGQIAKEATYDNGKLVGTYKEWYKDGVLKQEATPEYIAEKFLNYLEKGEYDKVKQISTESTKKLLETLKKIVGIFGEDEDVEPRKISDVICDVDGNFARCSYMAEDEEEEINLIKEDGKWLVDFEVSESSGNIFTWFKSK